MKWEFQADRPIYTQLIEEIELRIVTGYYPAGERMPTVRDLAGEAAVNPNTMQRALTELESGGLIRSQRTSGRFVTDDMDLIAKIKSRLASERVEAFLRSMKQLGFTRAQSIELLAGGEEE